MSYKPDLSQLFNAAFGVIPISYKLEQSQKHPNLSYQNIPTKDAIESSRMSWMGTPIIFPIKLNQGVYNRYNSTGVIESVSLNDWYFPAATLVDFRRAKKITKTNILGSNGTVKELYGFDDWTIRIRGFFLDTPKETALQQQKQLLKWEELISAIDVTGVMFNDKEIYKIVIEEIDIKQLKGSPNIIPFEITAVSDEPWSVNPHG